MYGSGLSLGNMNLLSRRVDCGYGSLPETTNKLSRWEEFRGLMDEREPKMLRAFTSMEVSPAGGLEQRHIKGMEVPLVLHVSLILGWKP